MTSVPPPVVRIATRNSPLAMWQAEHVASLLTKHEICTSLVPLVSGGDVDLRPIDGTRQTGVFTKRIQQALIEDEADAAVHSLKDLPTEVDARLSLAAVPERESVFDCLVSKAAWSIDRLPESARVGTGSMRRAAQLLSLRPDLRVLPIRGNLQTRLAKLDAGEYDSIVLAEAGLLRLGMDDVPRTRLSLEEMLPAPGQGALGIEVRSDDQSAIKALDVINDRDARLAVTAERSLLSALHGGCLAPIAAHAVVANERLSMTAVVLSPDGAQRVASQGECPIEGGDTMKPAIELASTLEQDLREQGAAELIRP